MESRITKYAAVIVILAIAGVGVGVLSQIAKPDVVLAISFDQLVWKSNEVPLFNADLVHRGKHELVRVGEYELEYDDVWYVDSGKVDTSDVNNYDCKVFEPDAAYRDFEFGLDHRWLSQRSSKPLRLTSGKHRVRLAFDATVPDETEDEPIRIVSGFADFRILKPGTSATEQDWLEIGVGGYPGLKYSDEQVAAKHLEEHGEALSYEELARFYYDKAFELSQRGGDPFEIAELAESALAVEWGDIARLRLYSILGSAYQRQTKKHTPVLWGRQRRIAALVLFAGLAEALEHGLPAEKPLRNGVFKYPDGNKDGQGSPLAQIAIDVARDPDRVRELVERRQTLILLIVYMYSRTPDAFDELHELAIEHIGDESAAMQLVEAAKAYRENSRSPIPAICVRHKQETGTGETIGVFGVYDIDGLTIEAGFVPDKKEIVFGEPLFVTFYVKNPGEKPCNFFVGGDSRGSVRHNNFRITAVDADGQAVKDPYSYHHRGGRGGDINLGRRDMYVERLYLGHWCAFEKPGIYTVTCERTLNERSSDRPQIPVAVSFEINITPYSKEKMLEIIHELGKQILFGNNLREASLALSDINEEAIVQYLAETMKSKADWRAKRPAIDGLSQFSSQESLEAIALGLKNPDEVVRRHAAKALGEMRSEKAFELLVKALADRHTKVRCEAAEALGTLGDPRCVDVLNRYTDSEDLTLRLSAVKGLVALKQTVRARWLTPVIKATIDINNQRFHEAIRVLRLYGGGQAAPGLVSCLQFDDPSLKNRYNMYLIQAIGASPGGPKYFGKYLHDPNTDGTPEQIEENRKILEALKFWLETQENIVY